MGDHTTGSESKLYIYFYCIANLNICVGGSDKSNEMSEKMKIEIALDCYCSVHDQCDTVLILRNGKFVYFL